MSKKELKTNAMRMLDRMKIPYEAITSRMVLKLQINLDMTMRLYTRRL